MEMEEVRLIACQLKKKKEKSIFSVDVVLDGNLYINVFVFNNMISVRLWTTVYMDRALLMLF